MKTLARSLIIGGIIALLGLGNVVYGQDGAYMTPTELAKFRKEKAQEKREEAKKQAEIRTRQEAEYKRLLQEQENVSDWYNRREMKVTIEEMEQNLEELDGDSQGKEVTKKGGRYSHLLRQFNGDAVVLNNVDKVYVIYDMDYDPWSGTYYGRDNRSGVSITINSNPWGYGYYGRPYYYGRVPYGMWYDPWYYGQWGWGGFYSPYWSPWGGYHGWYDPWYDPYYVGFGWSGFHVGWHSHYYYGGYYDPYWDGFYDGSYYAGRSRARYNSAGRSSGRYYTDMYYRDNTRTVTRARNFDHYGRELGVTRDAVRTRSNNHVWRGSDRYDYNSRTATRTNTRWDNNQNYTPQRSSSQTYSQPSRSTQSQSSSSGSGYSRGNYGGNSRVRR